MSIKKFVCLSVCLFAATLVTKAAPNDPPKPPEARTEAPKPAAKPAPEAEVKELMTKDLPDFPGKEGLMILVTYPPGSQDPIHRHNADAFVYVLEGSIVMQVRGGKEVTLKAGETFYEGPNDVHVVGRNASQTEPAKFVVILLKNKNAPVLVPVK
jgi:quercetin dioxygenase-like cupin family protein